jgi:hypothetical protein
MVQLSGVGSSALTTNLCQFDTNKVGNVRRQIENPVAGEAAKSDYFRR